MRSQDLPHALTDKRLSERLSAGTPMFFLDYDGTLTPIVSRPEDAVISESMRSVIKELASYFKVAIVTGRDKKDVEKLVGLKELIYAGSHGFDIDGPDGMQMQNEEAKRLLPALDQAEKELSKKLSAIPGSQVERKKFSIAVHYRNAADSLISEIKRQVDDVQRFHPELRKNDGKKIAELQPDIEWDKGRAVLWLIDRLQLNDKAFLPVYIGDDLTDEHAFAALEDRGIGILVDDHGQETSAQFLLQDTQEVKEFLSRMITLGNEKENKR